MGVQLFETVDLYEEKDLGVVVRLTDLLFASPFNISKIYAGSKIVKAKPPFFFNRQLCTFPSRIASFRGISDHLAPTID
jgi:hypothetical protein